jgi:hypothetical protein
MAVEEEERFLKLLLVGVSLLTVACTTRPTQISSSRKGAYEAALARVGDGFVAAWYDTRDGNAEIYIRSLDVEGRPVGPELRLTNGPEESYEASIARVGRQLVVAWYDQAIFCAWIRTEPSGEAVWGGWWDTDGRPLGASLPLGRASKTTWNLNAALEDEGAAWVVFDGDVSTRASELHAARLAGPTVISLELTKDDGAASKYPDLAISSEGRVALTWYDERDGNDEVYLLAGALSELKAEIDGRANRVTNTPGESIGAYLAWNGNRIGLSWSDKVGAQHEVFFQSFDAAGAPIAQAQRLTENVTWSLVPAIQPWRDGFAMAWNEYAPASVEVHVGASEVFFAAVR